MMILLVGDPGAGKTGAMAALANAGWTLAVANFDGNVSPLSWYVKPEAASRVHIRQFQDTVRATGMGFQNGAVVAAAQLPNVLSNWPGLGPADTWGPDKVLVIDPLSHLSDRMVNSAASMAGRPKPDPKDYGAMANTLEMFLTYLKGLKCHVICITHLRVLGEPMDLRKQSERDADPKVPAPEDSWKSTLSWKRFPSVAGRMMPPEVGTYFEVILHAKTEGAGRAARRVLSMVPDVDVDVKAPVHLFGGKSVLDIEQGGMADFLLKVAGAPTQGSAPAPVKS